MADNKSKDNTLREHGCHLMFQGVYEESVEEAVEFIFEANLNKSHKELTLVINSGGGSCYDGFALIDAMAGSSIPVKTVGLGCIASMGVGIFIAGHKGSRILTPNTTVMCHQWAGGMWGKEHELVAAIKGNEQMTQKMINHYVKHTGLKKADVLKYFFPAHDVWLNAKEAKKLGICDIVKEF